MGRMQKKKTNFKWETKLDKRIRPIVCAEGMSYMMVHRSARFALNSGFFSCWEKTRYLRLSVQAPLVAQMLSLYRRNEVFVV